jgi:LytS/YehU family sensor histidine kinase
MTGIDTGWSNPTLNRNIIYNLRSGKYSFAVRASYNGRDWIAYSEVIVIEVKFPFWQKIWFIVLTFFLLLLAVVIGYRARIGNIKKRASIKQQITELESKALRAQMNPHFIFNSLNAIQELIITENTAEGYKYLSSFSKLLRMVLNNSEKNFIPLSTELEMIQLYLSLEALRFKQSFKYEIIMDEGIEAEIIQVPSLLLQPYVENAVWHGLRHKKGNENLIITIKENSKQLQIEIDDNGIGRKKAAEIKSQKLGAEQFESKGTALAEQRITLLNQQYPNLATVKIEDKMNEKAESTGTKIIIYLPINIQ